MPDERDNNQPFEGRTFLYIRTHPLDDGTEPLPAALPSWMSPDLTVIKPDGSRGGEAVSGQINQIEAIVTNAGGIDAVDAYVEIFIANPSTGFTPALASLVGGGYVTVPGYMTQAIAFPWTPGPSDTGHRCIVARVQLIMPLDSYRDGTLFDVRGDRHVAQRNIEVVSLANQESVKFAFSVVNPKLVAIRTRVMVEEVRDPRHLAHVRTCLGCGFAQFGETPMKHLGLSVDKEPFVIVELAGEPRDERIRAELPRGGPIHRVAMERWDNAVDLHMEPGEVRQAVLYVERNRATRVGDLHAINVMQVDEGYGLLGGLTVVIRH